MIRLGQATIFETEYSHYLPFLKTGKKLSPNTTIEDINPEKIQDLIVHWTQSSMKEMLEYHRNHFRQTIRAFDPSIKSESDPLLALKEKTRKAFEECILSAVLAHCEAKITSFLSGTSFREALETLPDIDPPSFAFSTKDLISPPNDSRLTDIRLALAKKRLEKESEESRVRVNKLFDNPNLPVTIIHICQIQWFQEIAAALRKNISELTPEDLNNALHKLVSLVHQKEIETKEREAKEAEKELLALIEQEESQKSSAPTSKKKTKKTVRHKKTLPSQTQSHQLEEIKSSSSLSPLASKVLALNSTSFHSLYSFAPRVLRWGEPDPTKIRLFEDLNAGNEVVKKYANCTEEQLHFWRAKHNLSCFGKILSEQELCCKYSFPYEFANAQGRRHKGRSFYGEMEYHGQKYTGLISVAFNEQNVIYHALFENHEQKELTPAQMLPQIENSVQSQYEQIWQFTTPFQFSLEEDDQIKIIIGENSANCVIFHIYPLF